MPPNPVLAPLRFHDPVAYDESMGQVRCEDVEIIVVEAALSPSPRSGISACIASEEHTEARFVRDEGIHLHQQIGATRDVPIVEVALQRFERILVDNMASLKEIVGSLALLPTTHGQSERTDVFQKGSSNAVETTQVEEIVQTPVSPRPIKFRSTPSSTNMELGMLDSCDTSMAHTETLMVQCNSVAIDRGRLWRQRGRSNLSVISPPRRHQASLNVSTMVDYAVATDILRYLPDSLIGQRASTIVSFFRRLKDSRIFTVIVMSSLLASTITYGMQVDRLVIHGKSDPWLDATEIMCTAIFTLELIVRIAAMQHDRGKLDHSLVFDAGIVMSAWIDFVVTVSVGEQSAHITSFLTIVRSARSLRLCRLVCFLPQVRVVILTIVSSMNALFWLVLVMLCVMFVFAAVLTEGVGQLFQRGAVPDDLMEDMRHDFGSVATSMYTLFKCVIGGVSWGEPGHLTWHLGLGYFGVFLCYIALMMFSVLNVVLGFFVDGAIQLMDRDRELCSMRLREENKHIAEDLLALLSSLDTNGDGEISYSEWLHALANSDTRQLLEVLGFDSADAAQLFHLIDTDESGSIDLRELIGSMQRVRGKVTALHIDLVLRRLTRLKSVEKRLAKLS
eukprot:TRINITY_DN13732_c0_g1_i1.p1 TRINITY_DN13732_c0_g1~~TRINITY_DN13732_c0_g1_i1.p1  ORF type:complete len:647 (-),score=81.54 TRINITY_DN13732_c0_g1_i1:114-1970(-)